MVVYRLENKDGRGPYRTDWKHQVALCNDHDPRSDRSTLTRDFGCDDRLLCGFSSMEALEEWFHGWLEVLRLHDFEVVEYDVIGYLKGTGQIAFVKPSQF